MPFLAWFSAMAVEEQAGCQNDFLPAAILQKIKILDNYIGEFGLAKFELTQRINRIISR